MRYLDRRGVGGHHDDCFLVHELSTQPTGAQQHSALLSEGDLGSEREGLSVVAGRLSDDHARLSQCNGVHSSSDLEGADLRPTDQPAARTVGRQRDSVQAAELEVGSAAGWFTRWRCSAFKKNRLPATRPFI